MPAGSSWAESDCTGPRSTRRWPKTTGTVEGHRMKERLRGTDYRFIAICLALLGATVWFSAGNFYKAFPEASIDFKVSRASGRDAAATFLAGQGYSLSDYRDAAEFDYDDDAKTFLERTLGLEQGNALMGRRVRLWRW